MDKNKHIEKYKEAYEELKLILDSSFDQITIADSNGVFTRVSSSCEPFFGIKEKDMIGSSAFDLEEEGVFDTSVTAEVLRKGRKVTIVQKTAGEKTVMVTGTPILDDEGKIMKIVNISKDITEKQELANQLEDAKENLSRVQRELNKKEVIYDSNVLSKSKAMNKIIDLISHISDLDANVLLLGETGVGKGYIAKLIHESSIRQKKPFININCGAIPENLLESELFGYEKGAFTGAGNKGKKGLFEVAGKGTIFLDEIGDMPMNLQVKLLSVLDNKEIFRVGGEKPIKIEGRIVAATNKDLQEMISKGTFREDLYYRLNVVPIEIPPLRKRKEDIPSFINMFVKRFNKKNKDNKSISKEGYNILIDYNYPGNIRELENIIERLVITTPEDVIKGVHILEIIDLPDKTCFNTDDIIPIKEAVQELERNILRSAFNKYKTTREVAKVLEIDQSTVVKKAKKLNIKRN